MAAVTLKKVSRSKGWYGREVMGGILIWHIENGFAVKNIKIISKSCSHWFTLEK